MEEVECWEWEWLTFVSVVACLHVENADETLQVTAKNLTASYGYVE